MKSINWKKVKHAIYMFVIGWMIELVKKVYKEVRGLGWIVGSAAVILATSIFYAPVIVSFLIGHLEIAATYLAFWMAPFSPGVLVYLGLLTFIIKVLKYVQGKKGHSYGYEEKS